MIKEGLSMENIRKLMRLRSTSSRVKIQSLIRLRWQRKLGESGEIMELRQNCRRGFTLSSYSTYLPSV